MAFPFSITHTRKLKAKITAENLKLSLRYVELQIKKRKADNCKVINSKVIYKGSSGGKQSLLAGADSGFFEIITDVEQNSYLIYKFEIHGFITFALFVSFIFGIVSLNVWIGVVYLCSSLAINGLITSVRHGTLANELAEGLDSLHGIELHKEVESEKKSEELKNWF